jgi:TRAP-type mannitol/chloroaromatic compound transport system substrate-binding protein
MRIAGLAGDVMAKLGVVPQQIAGGDIYPALEKGTVDAAEWVGPYDDQKLGFVKVAPFYYYPGWWEGNAALHVMIGLDKWEALPKTYQAILRSACAEVNNWTAAKYDADNPKALRVLIASGAKLQPFSPPILEASLQAANEVYAGITAKNATFKKVYESMMAFRKDGVLWDRVAENTYDNFMARQSAANRI